MSSKEIRQKYLEFFKKRGHIIIPSASIVPENDPTTLFISSGMQPLLPYFLGKNHPSGHRVVNSQKCFRAVDMDEVGDNRHTTFFEMLGNWSFGDYFKKEQIEWIWEFFVGVIELDPNKIYITVFSGDKNINIPRDDEAVALWQGLFKQQGIEAKLVDVGSEQDGYDRGMRDGRIFAYDVKKNWWSRSGIPADMPIGEPGGPDSEIFYDFGTLHDTKWGKECHVNCDCGRFMEIGNNVFMQYKKVSDTLFEPLIKRNIDFGGGLERIMAASENSYDIFRVGPLGVIVKVLEKESGGSYVRANESEKRMFRIIADHIRAAIFLILDGIRPAPNERGYLLRRLLRRAILFGRLLGISVVNIFPEILKAMIAEYKDQYSEIEKQQELINNIIIQEIGEFEKTIVRGMRKFESEAKALGPATSSTPRVLSGEVAFRLSATDGFPVELTQEYAKKYYNTSVDMDAFHREVEKHKEISRAGIEQKFKGGLADHSEITVKYHTTHHILLKALQIVLGPEVHQRGSNITAERLRIDFVCPRKMTDEEKKKVEDIVNEKIKEHLPVMRTIMKKEEAERYGAEHEFNANYPDLVSIYSIGPKDATEGNPRINEAFSVEFCGGPHVANTEEIERSGRFKIMKEEAVAAGIRRIKGGFVL